MYWVSLFISYCQINVTDFKVKKFFPLQNWRISRSGPKFDPRFWQQGPSNSPRTGAKQHFSESKVKGKKLVINNVALSNIPICFLLFHSKYLCLCLKVNHISWYFHCYHSLIKTVNLKCLQKTIQSITFHCYHFIV
jgi:hypothetical protein